MASNSGRSKATRLVASTPMNTAAISTKRRGGVSRSVSGRQVAQVRMSGTIVSSASTLDEKRMRTSVQ